MRILEFMSFNPSWFLTLPGILITSGVILLLIALILLLTSTKKEEEEEIASQEVESYKPIVEDGLSVEPLEIKVPTVENVITSMPTMNEAPIEEKEIAVEPKVEQPQINTGGILDAINNINTVNEVNSNIDFNTEQASTSFQEGTLDINFDNIKPEGDIETPILNINEEKSEVVEEVPVAPEIPNLEIPSTKEDMSSVSIYGGASPTLDIHKSDFEPEKPVIYGGADPLENTAPIPTVPRQAYSASTVSMPQVNANPIPVPAMPVTEAKLVDPIAQPTEVTPSAIVDNSINDTISASPVVETLEL